jgi:hypothetical protein
MKTEHKDALTPQHEGREGFFQNLPYCNYQDAMEDLVRRVANESLAWYLKGSWTKLDFKDGDLTFYVYGAEGSPLFTSNISDEEWIQEVCWGIHDHKNLEKLADKLQKMADFVRAEQIEYEKDEENA